MKVIECNTIKEKAYFEKLENGLEVIIVPKKDVTKKYVIFGTRFGSIDNKFINPETNEVVSVPDGVAHFLEHKMFEQKSGVNSLDALMALGLEANAYTTNDHTAYLIESNEDINFYKGLDELMDYVQNPYYTDENVEKEKGIIGQEIGMYDDDPGFQLYINALKCLYVNNPIRIDIAGSVESISKITPQILFDCYNTFYNPNNMILVVCGDFEPNDILEEIKKRIVFSKNIEKINRLYDEEPANVKDTYIEKKMHVSMPIFMLGYKDRIVDPEERVKRHMAVQIIMEIILGRSSKLYKNLYENQIVFGEPDFEYEFSNRYAHILISGQADNPQLVKEMWISEVEKFKNDGFDISDVNRIKRKMYGEFVVEFNDVSSIGRMFLSDSVKNINTFDYVNKFDEVDKEYIDKVFSEIFNDDKLVLSVVKK